MEKFFVRKAKIDDAYWICFVNVHTRYTTYHWLMPEFLLKKRIKTIGEKTGKVRENIANGENYLVVENTETKKIIWMSIYWSSRNEKYSQSGEIYALYILKNYQKLGVGKKLLLAWIEELIKLWYNDLIINVLKWNNAINFYKKYWGKFVWERSDEIWKITIHEDILYFENIKSIKQWRKMP